MKKTTGNYKKSNANGSKIHRETKIILEQMKRKTQHGKNLRATTKSVTRGKFIQINLLKV